MGENSAIEYCHHSFVPWTGCEKVSPGCENCYAEAIDIHFGQHQRWGAKAIRELTSENNWKLPYKLNRKAEKEGARARIFASHMSDIGDKKAPPGARDRLWTIVRETPWLEWLLLTKRIGNIPGMLPQDWGQGYPNAGWMATVVNQNEADRDIPKLLKLPAKWRGLSVEPLLGPMNLRPHLSSLDWVIVGGESGSRARPMAPHWAESIRDQCIESGVAFFFKQWGEWAPLQKGDASRQKSSVFKGGSLFIEMKNLELAEAKRQMSAIGSKSTDIWMHRYGKKSGGCLLDGKEWKQYPEQHQLETYDFDQAA